jgi:hypothetical protein
MDASEEKPEHQKRATARIGDNRHLMRVSLQQGARILSELQKVRIDQAQHARDDAKMAQSFIETQGKQDTTIERLKTNQSWMKAALMGLATWCGLGQYIIPK